MAERLIRLGVIGAGADAAALAAERFDANETRIVGCAPSWDGAPLESGELAAAAGAEAVAHWSVFCEAGKVDAVVLTSADKAEEIAAVLLDRGIAVLLGQAPSLQVLESLLPRARAGGVVLTCPGDISHTPAGAYARSAVRDGSLGTMQSLFLSSRYIRFGANGDARRHDAVWSAAEAVSAFVGGRPVQSHTLTRTDGTTSIVRFDDTVVATVDVAEIPELYATKSAPVEAIIEVVCENETIRIEPYRADLRIIGEGRLSREHILDSTIREKVDSFVTLIREGAGESAVVQLEAALAVARCLGEPAEASSLTVVAK